MIIVLVEYFLINVSFSLKRICNILVLSDQLLKLKLEKLGLVSVGHLDLETF